MSGRVSSEIPALIGCHALGRLTVVGSGAGPSVLWERGPQPQEGPPERSSPGPGLVQAQDEPPPAPHEDGGDVQDPVADRLRLGLFELAVEAGHLRPGDERPGDEAGGHPGEVLGEASEGQVL